MLLLRLFHGKELFEDFANEGKGAWMRLTKWSASSIYYLSQRTSKSRREIHCSISYAHVLVLTIIPELDYSVTQACLLSEKLCVLRLGLGASGICTPADATQ
jgi:hypothetical protein